MTENSVSNRIIGAAIEVHRHLGPGLLESAYSSCLAKEFSLRGLSFNSEISLNLVYKGEKIDAGYRLDFLVENKVVVEIKSVEKLLPVHEAQLLSYLRISKLKLGLLINFNSVLLKNGIKRLANNL